MRLLSTVKTEISSDFAGINCMKVGYRSKAKAIEARGKIYKNNGRNNKLKAYDCPFCDLFHLATDRLK